MQAQFNLTMQTGDMILEANENIMLMPFLLRNLKHKSRNNVKSLLRHKQVWVNGQAISQFNHVLQPGHQVVIKWERASERNWGDDLSIVYEDDSILVVEKAAGLLSMSDGSGRPTAYNLLSEYVKVQNSANKIFIVHRLDRDTSGLMMFAKSEKVQEIMQNSWQTSISERTYIALVEGMVKEPEGTITSYLFEGKTFIMHSSQDSEKGELSITHFKTLKNNKDFSLLEVHLRTGKKNQIRVHMQDIGHCVVGDKKYGAGSNPIRRLGLHASVLAFKHPLNSDLLRFESKIPPEFLKVF